MSICTKAVHALPATYHVDKHQGHKGEFQEGIVRVTFRPPSWVAVIQPWQETKQARVEQGHVHEGHVVQGELLQGLPPKIFACHEEEEDIIGGEGEDGPATALNISFSAFVRYD